MLSALLSKGGLWSSALLSSGGLRSSALLSKGGLWSSVLFNSGGILLTAVKDFVKVVNYISIDML